MYKSTDTIPSEKMICFECSLNILECRDLLDWEDKPISSDTRVCPRCNKTKSSFRFCGGNKYCNFCLLKKKWTRTKEKMMKNEIISDSDTDNEITIFKSKKPTKKHILCDFCGVNADAKDIFLYIDKSDEYVQNKNMCFKCSLNVKDFRLLTDWICNDHRQNSRYCTRCKKWKSICRFTEGKKNCQYCSLKRKRLYILQKQTDQKKSNNLSLRKLQQSI